MGHDFGDEVSFIWGVADLLRGPYRPNQYGKVILPLTVLRRLDCLLEPTREKVRAKHQDLKAKGMAPAAMESVLNRAAAPPDWPKDRPFLVHNVSRFDFPRLKDDPNHIARNLSGYIKGFSPKVREIFEPFGSTSRSSTRRTGSTWWSRASPRSRRRVRQPERRTWPPRRFPLSHSDRRLRLLATTMASWV